MQDGFQNDKYQKGKKRFRNGNFHGKSVAFSVFSEGERNGKTTGMMSI